MNKYAVENLFGIQSLNIAWYGILVGLAFAAGVVLSVIRGRRRGLKADDLLDFFLICIPSVLVGARLYYVAFRWEEFAPNPLRIFAVWEGGLAIYGGVIVGVTVAVLFARRRKLPFTAFTDAVVPCLPLGQAIGRWGNFVNQEAFGNAVTDPAWQFFPYAVYIDRLSEWHQATFFYESAWNALLAAALLLTVRGEHGRGLALPLYCIVYGAGRFFIESLRADSLYLLPGVRVSQLVSAALVILGCVLLILRKKRRCEVLDAV